MKHNALLKTGVVTNNNGINEIESGKVKYWCSGNKKMFSDHEIIEEMYSYYDSIKEKNFSTIELGFKSYLL